MLTARKGNTIMSSLSSKNLGNILVTGGAGNIGTNLCNELRSRGHKVIAADLYNTERDDYIRADVRNYRQIEHIFDTFGFTRCF